MRHSRWALILIALVAVPVWAQESESTWYFAATETQLLAYTLDGQVNVIAEGENMARSFRRGFRLAPNRAFVLQEADIETFAFLMTSDGLSRIGTEPLPASIIQVLWRAPYLIYSDALRDTRVGWVINTDALTLTPLTGFNPPRYSPGFIIRMRPDGQTLRYFSLNEDSRDATMGTLWERNLATGQETPLFTTDSSLGRPTWVFSTVNGAGWWFRYRGEDPRTPIIVPFGDAPDLVTQVLSRQISPTEVNTLLEDASVLVRVNPQCEADCPIELTSIFKGDTVRYTLPVQQGVSSVQHIYEGGGILVDDDTGDALWFLEPDGGATLLGMASAQTLATSDTLYASYDWRWVVGIEEGNPQTYRVWDLPRGAVVLEGMVETFMTVLFQSDMVLTQNFSAHAYSLYDASGDQVFSLPDPMPSGGAYMGLFPGAQVLVQQVREAEGRQPGLYRYDPAAQTYHLLVENALAVTLRSLN